MANDEANVVIKISGDATEFQKSVKSAAKASEDLHKLTETFKKAGLKGSGELAKISSKHNRSDSMKGKEALKLEQKLHTQMQRTIQLMKAKQKQHQGNATAIKNEIAQLAKLQEAHGKVQAHRKSTGLRTNREAAGDFAKPLIQPLRAAMVKVGASIVSAAGAIVAAVGSTIRRGYAAYISHGRAQAGLAGMGSIAAGTYDRAQKLGFSSTETVQQMRGVGRATGNINAVNQAQRVARSFGGEVSEISAFMGVSTRAGHGFGGKAGGSGKRTLERIMQHAFTSGLDRSRAGEHLSAVASAVQSAQSVSAGKVDVNAISSLLTFFSRSGAPGLQGAAGANTIMRFDAAMRNAGNNPTGGDPVTAMMYQSQGFGAPGGAASHYQATRNLQRGIADPENLLKMFNRFNQEGGAGSEQANMMISRATSVSLPLVEEMQRVIAEGGGTDAVLTQLAELATQALPTDEQQLKVGQEHLKVAQRVAYLENRLVKIGEDFAPHIEALETMLNSVVDKLLPGAKVVLTEIVAWLEKIHRLFMKFMDFVGVREEITTNAGRNDVNQLLTSNKSKTQILASLKTSRDAAMAKAASYESRGIGDDLTTGLAMGWGATALTPFIGEAQRMRNRAGARGLAAGVRGVSEAVQRGEQDPQQLLRIRGLFEARRRLADLNDLSPGARGAYAMRVDGRWGETVEDEAARLRRFIEAMERAVARREGSEGPTLPAGAGNLDPGASRAGSRPSSGGGTVTNGTGIATN